MRFGDKNLNIGIMVRREHPPEHLRGLAQGAEAAGYDEVWVVEDLTFGGGIASATTALAVTDSILVGLGIMPAVARNPAYAAMEIATLARLYPDRFLPGFGHGVTQWIEQVGAMPRSQLAALGETTEVVRRLLHGEKVDFDGDYAHIADAQLLFPPAAPPPISLGVRGIKSLQLAGRVADGTILSEFASPTYAKWAREQIAVGQAEGQLKGHHRLSVFVMAYFGDHEATYAAAKARVVAGIYKERIDSQLEPMGILDQAVEMRQRHALEAEIPEDWVRQLVIVGGKEAAAEAVRRYAEAGVDSLILVPPPEQALAIPDEINAHLMSYLT
jgi:5,10-methylenetetrahydromethanopterin reductase